MNKISLRGEKSIYKYYKEKINMQQVLRIKISTQQVPRKKSACNKFHEQNWFHKEKNQCTSFTPTKMKIQHASRAKISRFFKFLEKISTQQVA